MAWTPRTWWRTASCEPQVPARSRSCPGILFRKPLYLQGRGGEDDVGDAGRGGPGPGFPGAGQGEPCDQPRRGNGTLGGGRCWHCLWIRQPRRRGGFKGTVDPGKRALGLKSTCTTGVALKLQRRCYVHKSERIPGERCVRLLWTSETPLSPGMSFPVGAWLPLALDSQCCTKPLRNLQRCWSWSILVVRSAESLTSLV